MIVLFVSTLYFFFFQAEDGIRDDLVTGVQTCALPISSVLGSRFPSEPWYIVSNQRVPFLSNSSERLPTGASDLNLVTGNSVSLSVFGSNLEMKGSPKSEYQTFPCASTITSCGSVVDRGRSYSVMMARVARPVGRARALRGYCHFSTSLRLMLARYSAGLRYCSGVPDRAGSSMRCGLICSLAAP